MTSEIINEEQKKDDIIQIEEAEKVEDYNNMDFKQLYYSHPSQKNKKKKDFTEYSRIDMKLLSKKRERENPEENKEKTQNKNDDEQKNENEIEENVPNKEKKERKEKDWEKHLPEELIELIEQTKNIEPWTISDFQKYRAYRKLNINL